MLGRSKMAAVREHAGAASELAAQLARDKKFRKQLSERREARLAGEAARGWADRLAEPRQTPRDRCGATRRGAADDGRPAGGLGEAAVQAHQEPWSAQHAAAGRPRRRPALALRKRRTSKPSFSGGTTPRVIESSIEVAVPVSAAYNQWTQFEEFPQFMDGVEEVRQLGDTRLHWVASVGGRRAEWDAKILEQHPDRQISWISEDGKKTRGTVTFESLGEKRTLVRLSLGYQAEGFVEAVGSAAGLDRRRVEGDLARFKELIEGRGTETGAWREDISAGTKT